MNATIDDAPPSQPYFEAPPMPAVGSGWAALEPPPIAHAVVESLGASLAQAAPEADGRPALAPYYQDEAVTLYLGDCREIAPLLGAVDLIVTDPPYGHNQGDGDLAHHRESALGIRATTEADARPIANDGPAEANGLARWLFAFARKALAHGGCCCCGGGGGGGPDPQFARWSLCMDELLGFKQMVVWDKGGLGMGWHYRRNYEVVLVGEKPGGPCKWYGGNAQPNVVRMPGIKPRADEHPTPKPEELMALFIRLHSLPGELVLDPFAGAGSTLRAAKNLGRRAIGIEIDERFCEMAARRCAQEVLGLA